MSEINNVFNCCDGAYNAKVMQRELYRNYYIALLHSLRSDSHDFHFIDEEPEDQKVAACLGIHGWYAAMRSSNLDLSDVKVQLVQSLCSSGFKEEEYFLR